MTTKASKMPRKTRRNPPPQQFFCFGFFILSLLQISIHAFVTAPTCSQPNYVLQQQQEQVGSLLLLWSSSSPEEEEESTQYQNLFSSADLTIQTIRLLPHKPLGMTIEESLADDQFVLITRVVEGGFAEKAGLKVGDVLVGVTNLFANGYGFDSEEKPSQEASELAPCIGLGVEKMYVALRQIQLSHIM